MPKLRHAIYVFLCVATLSVVACTNNKNSYVFAQFHESTDCQDGWDNLWKAVKENNPHARFEMLFLLEESTLLPPGVHDIKQRMRLMTILDAYLLGYEAETALGKDIVKYLPSGLKSAFRDTRPARTKEFFQCLSDSPSPKCTEIAVREKLIPPFEEVIKKIDAAQMRREKPRCYFRDSRSAGTGNVEVIHDDNTGARKSDKSSVSPNQK